MFHLLKAEFVTTAIHKFTIFLAHKMEGEHLLALL